MRRTQAELSKREAEIKRDVLELFAPGSTVKITSTTRRVFATLYELSVNRNGQRQDCIAKYIHRNEDLPAHYNRSQSSDPIEVHLPKADVPGLEFKALDAIRTNFDSLGDSRFQSLNVHGAILGELAFVMEKSTGESLSKQMRARSFGRDGKGQLEQAAIAAGDWLRELHRMPALAHTEQCHRGLETTLEEFAAIFEFLKNQPGVRRSGLSRVAKIINASLAQLDQQELPLALNHHDFAPRNILVLPNGAITVIDTGLEECRPTFEDIADFLVDLRINKLQVLSGGIAFSKRTRGKIATAFLSAYFSESPVPWRCVRIFEAREMLIYWSALLWEKNNGPTRSNKNKIVDAVRIKAIRSNLNSIANELEREFNSLGSKESDSLVSEIGQRVSGYFGDAEAVSVSKKRVTEYKFSTIMEFDVCSDASVNSIIVKKARNPLFEFVSSENWITENDRPRLTLSMPPEAEVRLEVAAMICIDQHFRNLSDPTLKSIEVIDFIENESALVLEKIEWPTLETHLKGAASDNSVNEIFANVGRWLKSFHRLDVEHSQLRDASVDDYRRNLLAYIDFLKPRLGGDAWFEIFRQRVIAILDQGVLDSMPLATCHADFAPHNIFVGPQAEICGFDTLARWRKPIFEDLAYFQCILQDNPSSGTSEKREGLNRMFLNGYFENQPIPFVQIRLFQLLIFLDKWSSFVFSISNTRGAKKIAKQFRLIHRNRRQKSRLVECLSCIELDVAKLKKSSGDISCKA